MLLRVEAHPIVAATLFGVNIRGHGPCLDMVTIHVPAATEMPSRCYSLRRTWPARERSQKRDKHDVSCSGAGSEIPAKHQVHCAHIIADSDIIRGTDEEVVESIAVHVFGSGYGTAGRFTVAGVCLSGESGIGCGE